jgi:hypothetical protein
MKLQAATRLTATELTSGLKFNDKRGRWEWDDGTVVEPEQLSTKEKQKVQQWKAANPGKRPSSSRRSNTRGENTRHGSGFGGR